MRKIQLLDCTLRDGGYINDWKFGEKPICQIIEKLISANIEIIECGYLNENAKEDSNSTLYPALDYISEKFLKKYPKQHFACMINYGDYSLETLGEQLSIENLIIRVAFHKKDKVQALSYTEEIIKKGYRVFLQPMGTANYTDGELLDLIEHVNEMQPEAFYIVDSFGTLEVKEFSRLIYIVDHNLKNEIQLGYHSHDNKKQAYSNTQCMIEILNNRNLLIDASVFGMGRGAGNLNEELFASYLNNNHGKNYEISPMLEIIDLYLNRIYMENPWGYQLPYYLSAKHNCHPDYATFFSNKNSLTVASMNEIFESMTDEERMAYSADKALEIYDRYQNNHVDDMAARKQLLNTLDERVVLLLGPGKTINTHKTVIHEFIKKNDPIIFSLNFVPQTYQYSYVICTNQKRWSEVENVERSKLIVSSNIKGNKGNAMVFNYETIKCKTPEISDNVTLMLLHLLIQIGISEVYCAGLDGFHVITTENFADFTMSLGANSQNRAKRNELITKELQECEKEMKIKFLTPSVYTKK